MAFHIDCYKKYTGNVVSGYTAKYNSKCQAGSACLHGGFVVPGSQFFSDPAYPVRANQNNTTATTPSVWGQQPPTETLPANTTIALASDSTSTTVNSAEKTIVNVKLNYDQERTIIAALTNKIPGLVQTAVRDAIRPDDIVAEVTGKVSMAALAKVNEINKQATAKLEETQVIIQKKLDEIAAITRVEIKTITGEVKDCGVQHRQFPILLKAVMARTNVWMAGPSGSGKTTAAQNVAKALGLTFRYTGAVGDPYALVGYNDANGRYIRTAFREAWEHGGLFLWDEVDASDPNALLAFNAALANGTAPFPDACIDRHKDCVLIAAANTWGHGATNEYVGRLKMDAAFIKRFVFLSWQYDDSLEMATAPNKAWTKRVQEIRKRVAAKGIRSLVTPRESYLGAALLAAGIDQDTVENMTIRSGMTDEQWSQINGSTDPINTYKPKKQKKNRWGEWVDDNADDF